ncbi:MAG: hypothetical protein KA383_18430 [Phycisphaerae bacterium]|mgnify:FL=1|nr:hypothetical protein [Phycisphaerae bacterium]HQL54323.1 hypothetical protein [Phycisphaerae bacterium]
MPIWFCILAATAFGGALVVWHAVSEAKHTSEQMLEKYQQVLAQAREEKARQLAKEAEEAAEAAEEEAS